MPNTTSLGSSGMVLGMLDNGDDRKESVYRSEFVQRKHEPVSHIPGDIEENRLTKDILMATEDWHFPVSESQEAFTYSIGARRGILADDVRRDLRKSHFRIGDKSEGDWVTSHQIAYQSIKQFKREPLLKASVSGACNIFEAGDHQVKYESESMGSFLAANLVSRTRQEGRGETGRSHFTLSSSSAEPRDYTTTFSDSFKKYEMASPQQSKVQKEELRRSHITLCGEGSMGKSVSECKSQYKWPILSA